MWTFEHEKKYPGFLLLLMGFDNQSHVHCHQYQTEMQQEIWMIQSSDDDRVAYGMILMDESFWTCASLVIALPSIYLHSVPVSLILSELWGSINLFKATALAFSLEWRYSFSSFAIFFFCWIIVFLRRARGYRQWC